MSKGISADALEEENKPKKTKKREEVITENKPNNSKVLSGRRVREIKKREKQENWLKNYIISHGNKTKANKLSGISAMTLSRWQQNDKFKAKVEETKQELLDNAEQELYSRGLNKSDTALIEYLRANHPTYKRKTDNTIQINNIVPILQGDTKKKIKGDVIEGKFKAT